MFFFLLFIMWLIIFITTIFSKLFFISTFPLFTTLLLLISTLRCCLSLWLSFLFKFNFNITEMFMKEF